MMGSALTYVFALIAALAVLVVIHELGHYLVARYFDVKVLRFSFGFGRTVWVRRYGSDQTEWAICLIPLGGYVRMLDESEGDVLPAERPRAFNNQALRKRALIVAAGPLANLLLAVALYAAVFAHGVHEFPAVLGKPLAGSVAEQAGLSEGSQIVAVNGREVTHWQQVRWSVLQGLLDSDDVALSLRTIDGAIEDRILQAPPGLGDAPERDALRELGLMLRSLDLPPQIGAVVRGGAAELAGIRKGDRILALDGEPVTGWEQFASRVRERPGQPVRLVLGRGDGEFELTATPLAVRNENRLVGRLGVAPEMPSIDQDPRAVFVRYGPFEAIALGASQTWQTSVLTVRLIGRMLIGQVSWKHVSGPVTMADYAGQSAQAGFTVYLRFLALISISLGILNLLPIPVLDGGHLMYYLFEAVAGKPLPESVMNVAQRVGIAIIGMLMFFAFYNDINRLVAG